MEFAEIPGHQGYLISRDGVVLGWSGRPLKPQRDRDGYWRLKIYRDDKSRRNAGVHDLLLRAFVGPPPSAQHVPNHVNGVKDDNRLENLEWVTQSRNAQHAYDIGLHAAPWLGAKGSDHPGFGHTCPQRVEIDLQAFIGDLRAGKWPHMIARERGWHRTILGNIIHNKHWQSAAFWQLAGDLQIPHGTRGRRKKKV